jgi:uncharacterized protein
MGPGSSLVCSIRLNTTLTDEQRTLYQNEDAIRTLLADARNIAIVGHSADNRKASHFVGSYLQSEGYNVFPVNPGAKEILGRKVYPDLLSIPEKIDIVNVFRPAHEIPEITEQAIRIGAKCLWLQLRLIDFESAEKARKAGLVVVMDKCVKMELGRFCGSLHWAGMNTEIVSARRPRLVPADD